VTVCRLTQGQCQGHEGPKFAKKRPISSAGMHIMKD